MIYVGRPAFGQEESTDHAVQARRRTVKRTARRSSLGRSSVNQIEIREGLQPGDQVILSDMSSYDQFDRVKIELAANSRAES